MLSTDFEGRLAATSRLYHVCAELTAWQGRASYAESAPSFGTHRSQPVLPICKAAVGQATAKPQQAVPAVMLQPAQKQCMGQPRCLTSSTFSSAEPSGRPRILV